MARRRSQNRRSSMRKSLDQSGFLLDNSNVNNEEIDENFLDEYLGNQTNASDPSATIKLSLTQQLNSDSEVDKSNISENWYKSKNITTPSQDVMPKPSTNRILRTKRDKSIINDTTSASDSDNQTEIIKKRRPLFGKYRKSKGEPNLYENALKSDNDKTIESEPTHTVKRTSNAVERGSMSFDEKIPKKKPRLTKNTSFHSHQDSNTSTDSEKPRKKRNNLFRVKNTHERKSVEYNDIINDDDESFVGPSQPLKKSADKQLSVTLNMSQEKPRFTPDIKKSVGHSRRVSDDYDKHEKKTAVLGDKITNRISSHDTSKNSYTNVSTKRVTDENNSRIKSFSVSNKKNVSISSQDIGHEGDVTVNTTSNDKKNNADVIDETKYTMTQESTPSISDESRKSSQSSVNNISHDNTMSSSIRRDSQMSQDISNTSSISEKLKESSSDSISSVSNEKIVQESIDQDYEIEQVDSTIENSINDLITDDSEEPKYDDADNDNIQEDEEISVDSLQKNNSSRMNSSLRNTNQTAEEKLIEISQEQSVHEAVKNKKSKSPLSSKSNDQSLDKTTPTTTTKSKESTKDNKKNTSTRKTDSSKVREIKTPKSLKKTQQTKDSMDTPFIPSRKSENIRKRSLDLSKNNENKSNKKINSDDVDDDKTTATPRRSARLSKIAIRKSESEGDHQLSKTTRKSTRQSKSNIKETDKNNETKKNNTIRKSSVRNSSAAFGESSNTQTVNDDNSDDDDDDHRIFDHPSKYDTLEMNRSDSINIESNIEDEIEITKPKSPLKNESVIEKNKTNQENKKSIGNSSESSNILAKKKKAVTPLPDDSDDKHDKSTENNNNVSHINEEQEKKIVDEKTVSNLEAIDDEEEDSNCSAESRGDTDEEEDEEEEEEEDNNDDDVETEDEDVDEDEEEDEDEDVSKPQENTTQATNENYESPSRESFAKIQEETAKLIDTLESNSYIPEIDNDDENKQNNSNIINKEKSINVKENTQNKDKTNVTGSIDLSNSQQHLSTPNDETKRKSSYKPGPRSSKNLSSRKPLSPAVIIQTPISMSTPDSPKKNTQSINKKGMTNINQTNSIIQSTSNNDDDNQKSTPVAIKNTTKKSGKISTIESIDQSKITQTKISNFFKPLSSTISQNLISTEFDKKLIEAKNKLDKNEKLDITKIINNKQNIQQTNPLKKMLLAKKQLINKNKNNKKIIDKAYLVDGKFYKVPKLPRPKHWVTDKLYKFLWNKMESKYGTSTRVKSEKFIRYLADCVTIIQRRKEYKNYKDDLDDLMKKMATLEIIKTPFDFNHFCYDFLPYEFRVKVIPMLMPGGKTNIPFYPDKLYTPIINDKRR